MTTLRFEIDTEAKYSPSELETLQDNFIDWISELDGDADGGTADVRIVGEAGSDNVAAKALELIKSGTLHVSIAVKDDDGEEIFATGETLIALA